MRTRLTLLAAVVALVASGCFRVHLDIDVRDDGSGEISGLVALDAEGVEDLAGAMMPDDEGVEDLCEQFEQDQGLDDPRLETTPYNEDGFCGVEFRAEFTAEEFDAELLSDFADEGAVLRRDGDGWLFEMPLDTDELASETGDGDMLPGFDDFFSEAEYFVRVKLPGRQVDHNADYIDNEGFAVWEVDVLDPPTESLRLRTEPGETILGNQSAPGGDDGGGNALAIVLVILLVVVVVGLGAWYFMRNRNQPELATADAGTSGAPSPPTGPTSSDAAATVIDNPTPEQATGTPVWDPSRAAYVQWNDSKGGWMRFDEAAQEWVDEA